MISFPDRDVPKMAYWKYVSYYGIFMDGEQHMVWFCPVCNKEVTRIMRVSAGVKEMPPDGASFCKHCGQRLKYPVGNIREAWRGTHDVEVKCEGE